MANTSRGEVSLDLEFEDRKDHWVFRFTNAGHRATEDFLNMETSEIMSRVASGRVGMRLTTGLLLGATRKYHSDDFPTVSSIDDYMDQIDDEAKDASKSAQDLLVALVAAYTKSNPSDIEAALLGEENTPEAPKGGRGKPTPKKSTAKKTPKPASDIGENS